MTALEQLEQHGDCVEQGILAKAQEQLSACLQPYATIWADHILPRRLPCTASRVVLGWMPFAGSHYTALIRTFHAWESLEQLRTLCNQEERFADAAFLLDIHKVSASFWLSQGAAIDTLGYALTAYPGKSVKDGGKDHLVTRNECLKYAYDRRTQYIHSPLVPVRASEGGVVFHFEHLGNSKPNYVGVQESTDWKSVYTREELLDEFYSKAWDQFLKAITGAWWYLDSKLKDDDEDWRNLANVQSLPDQHHSSGDSDKTPQLGLVGGSVVSGFGFDDSTPQSDIKPSLGSRLKPPPPSDPPSRIPPSGMP